ncbi:MAG: hypothetical protein PHX78_08330 [bacterium]|nr:hypothetical protein [bacterium]
MSQIKICPECREEYQPHIIKCVHCGTILVPPEEIKDEKKELTSEEIMKFDNVVLENPVAVREGDSGWIREIFIVLVKADIPCAISQDDGCGKGCCGDKSMLLVSEKDMEKAHEKIEEYCMKKYPELKTSNEMISKGKCPACGSPVETGAVECPDCGLILLIIEKEKK